MTGIVGHRYGKTGIVGHRYGKTGMVGHRYGKTGIVGHRYGTMVTKVRARRSLLASLSVTMWRYSDGDTALTLLFGYLPPFPPQ